MTVPADLINRALDAVGRSDLTIGDPKEGTEGARAALRIYDPCLKQMLRASHWPWARKTAPLTLLADATGQTANVGTVVLPGWRFEYAYPVDCVKAHFLPWNNSQGSTGSGGLTTLAAAVTSTVQNTIQLAALANLPASGQYNVTIDSETMTVLQGQGSTLLTVARGVNGTIATTHALGASVTMVPIPPLMTGLEVVNAYGARLQPARFQVALDYNYPVEIGAISSWQNQSQWWEVYGEGPQQRTVILTNVQNASLVYTALVIYPSQWDDLFAEAFVQLMASKLALPLNKDKKFGLQMRQLAILEGKNALSEARAVAAQEAGFPQSTDHVPDFIRTRAVNRGGWSNGNSGDGCGFGGWDDVAWGSDSVF